MPNSQPPRTVLSARAVIKNELYRQRKWTPKQLVTLTLALGLGTVGAWHWLVRPAAQSVQAYSANSATAQPFDAQVAQREYTQAREWFARDTATGQAPSAQTFTLVQQLVTRYPTYAPARTLYGQALILDNQPTAAREQLRLSLELDPRQAIAHELAGSLALLERDLTVAARHYSQAIGLSPTDMNARLGLARVHITAHQYDQARRVLLEAIAAQPDLHTAYALLSDVYAQQGQLTLALTQMEKAVSTLPPDAAMDIRVLYVRRQAGLLRRDNRARTGLTLLQDFIKAQPTLASSSGLVEDQAVCWMLLDQPGRAVEVYQQALAKAPDDLALQRGLERWISKTQGR